MQSQKRNTATVDVNKIKKSMRIAKRATLRHYILQLGKLYGEEEESLRMYAEEQVVANEENLDKAIDCFKGFIPPEDEEKKRKEERIQRWDHPKKWRDGSLSDQ
jgi:hypothetical protein